MTSTPGAAGLLRSVGLMADGPAVWGRPVPAGGGGVFVIELPAPLPTAPIELTRVGKWIERVETLRLDGERPTSKALVARLAAFWLPSQTVLYVGASEHSISRRVAAIAATELGDRRPNSAAHWLRTLRSLKGIKVWWAATDAPEEYEDALLGAFADGIPSPERAALPDTTVVLPFANLRRPTGERKATGLTGSLIAEPVVPALPPTRIVEVPDGDAEGARGEPPRGSRKDQPPDPPPRRRRRRQRLHHPIAPQRPPRQVRGRQARRAPDLRPRQALEPRRHRLRGSRPGRRRLHQRLPSRLRPAPRPTAP